MRLVLLVCSLSVLPDSGSGLGPLAEGASEPSAGAEAATAVGRGLTASASLNLGFRALPASPATIKLIQQLAFCQQPLIQELPIRT